MTEERKKVLDKISELKEEGCVLCGSMDRLEFHHFIQGEKHFEIGGGCGHLETLEEELQRTILLCQQCHMSWVHTGPLRDEFYITKAEAIKMGFDFVNKGLSRDKRSTPPYKILHKPSGKYVTKARYIKKYKEVPIKTTLTDEGTIYKNPHLDYLIKSLKGKLYLSGQVVFFKKGDLEVEVQM